MSHKEMIEAVEKYAEAANVKNPGTFKNVKIGYKYVKAIFCGLPACWEIESFVSAISK